MAKREDYVIRKGSHQCIRPSNSMQYDPELDWNEYQRMLHSIGWNGKIPHSFGQCRRENKELLTIINLLNKDPTKIRSKELFISTLGYNTCIKHKTFIQNNLNVKFQNTTRRRTANNKPYNQALANQIDPNRPELDMECNYQQEHRSCFCVIQ